MAVAVLPCSPLQDGDKLLKMYGQKGVPGITDDINFSIGYHRKYGQITFDVNMSSSAVVNHITVGQVQEAVEGIRLLAGEPPGGPQSATEIDVVLLNSQNGRYCDAVWSDSSVTPLRALADLPGSLIRPKRPESATTFRILPLVSNLYLLRQVG